MNWIPIEKSILHFNLWRTAWAGDIAIAKASERLIKCASIYTWAVSFISAKWSQVKSGLWDWPTIEHELKWNKSGAHTLPLQINDVLICWYLMQKQRDRHNIKSIISLVCVGYRVHCTQHCALSPHLSAVSESPKHATISFRCAILTDIDFIVLSLPLTETYHVLQNYISLAIKRTHRVAECTAITLLVIIIRPKSSRTNWPRHHLFQFFINLFRVNNQRTRANKFAFRYHVIAVATTTCCFAWSHTQIEAICTQFIRTVQMKSNASNDHKQLYSRRTWKELPTMDNVCPRFAHEKWQRRRVWL